MKDVPFLLGGFTSFAVCFVLQRLFGGLRVPAYPAIVLACALSQGAHYWFWVEWVGITARYGGFWTWIGIHPLYLIGAIDFERDARRKRAPAAPGTEAGG